MTIEIPSQLLVETGQAIARGVAFLEETQLASGELPVFTSTDRTMELGGTPDPSIFPTAVIARALSDCRAASAVVARAQRFLMAERDGDHLWRHWTREHDFYAQLPPDLDDTSCASAVMARAGLSPDNRALILANRNTRGLFFTWIAPRPRWTGAAHMKVTLAQLRHALTLVGFFRQTSAKPYDVDAVVNANCLSYLGDFEGRQAVIDHLLGVIEAGTEAQCDKWYENPFVVRYFLSRALAEAAPASGEKMVCRIAGAEPSNALEIALTLCSLRYWRAPQPAALIERLLSLQLRSGAWRRAALYHGGRTRRRDGTFAPPHPDTPNWGSEALTTGFCIEALSRPPDMPAQ